MRIGTRGSALARTQADRVIALLEDRLSLPAEPVVIRTEGDIDKTSPLTVIGGRGVFTSALEEALLLGGIDAAVHSAKDLPSDRPAAFVLAAFPEREDARDVLVSRHGRSLADLPPRPTIGTSSRRRAMQIRLRRPDARVVELRGNIDTRLRKALETEVDAIVLAAAGVRRMGWQDRITEVLPLDAFVPSPGQGALAVETRAEDRRLVALLAALDDPTVSLAVRTERAFLRAVGGGCTAPIGAHVAADGDVLRLLAMLGSDDGTRVVWADEPIDPLGAVAAAEEVAGRLLTRLTSDGGNAVPIADPGTGRRGVGFAATDPSPLTPLSVLVTRPRAQADRLLTALRDRGADPIELPAIRIEDPVDPAALDAARARLAAGGYDWVVFSSANAVDRFARGLHQGANCRDPLAGAAVAAVGRATAAALTAAGIGVDLQPDRQNADGLVEAFAARGVAGARVLFPKAADARETLPAGLRGLGAAVDVVDAYRTVGEEAADPAAVARLLRGEVDVVAFASPSAVHGLRGLLGDAWPAVARTRILCVGSVTANAAREAGLPVDVVATDPTTEGVLEALIRFHAVPASVGIDHVEARVVVGIGAATGGEST